MSDDDDRLDVLEEATIDDARIAQLVIVGLPNSRERSLTVLDVSGVAHRRAKAA